MIIDVHRHIVVKDTVQGDYIRGAQKSFAMMYRKSHKVEISNKDFTEKVVRPLIDPNGDNIVAEMDKAGVDKSVIFGVDYGLVYGDPPMNIFDTNKHYAKAAQRHPDRFIPFVAIDPRRNGALRHCEEMYHEWGMKGFKMHPGVGYMPWDPCCFWIYEKAREWNLPILIHTGGAPATRLNWEYSRPLHAASAAALYPEVDFIFAHCGDVGWWQEAIQAAMWMPNVYVDLSLWQDPYVRLPKARFYQWLRDIIDLAGAEKILFATDAPYPNLMCPLKEWADAFRNPQTDIKFTQEEIDLIMGEAARKVLRLN